MKHAKVILLLMSCLFLSCKEEVKGFDLSMLIKDEIEGTYHYIEEERIDLFLPLDFYRINEADHKDIAALISDEKERQAFEKAMEIQSFLKDKTYNFIAQKYSAWLALTMLPVTPFTRKEAGQVLFYINRRYDKIQDITGVYNEKISSSFSATSKANIVNVVYKSIALDNKLENRVSYDNVYVISTKKKTIMIILTTLERVDFSGVISKIKLEDG